MLYNHIDNYNVNLPLEPSITSSDGAMIMKCGRTSQIVTERTCTQFGQWFSLRVTSNGQFVVIDNLFDDCNDNSDS